MLVWNIMYLHADKTEHIVSRYRTLHLIYVQWNISLCLTLSLSKAKVGN